jgi:E3 ubiquitin-protein ligase SHPRH
LSKYIPEEGGRTNIPWSLSDFYDSVHVPSIEKDISPQIPGSLPDTTLYPFQQRAVDWLLRREGVTFPASGGTLSPTTDSTSSIPVSFQTFKDATGKKVHVSHLRGMIVSDVSTIVDSTHALRGGILAEEMGLGKTVELIALMSLHKRQIPKDDVVDTYTGALVKPSGATLIISPPSILEQWRDEIKAHAPWLKVKHYKGLPPPSAREKEHMEATVENLMEYDVVLTTYTVLSREIHFAKPLPDRSLRHKKQHEPRKSPLVQISWWRVCLDEAQMVESGVSQAATVARIIPRCNAWAVSGTPLRKDVQDLRGLLTFLRYEPFAGCKSVWDRLDKPSFRSIFGQIALRHTKDKIREELRLPPQKRVVITVPFTAIEEQNYSEMIQRMCEACGLSPEGHPLQEGRDASDPEVVDRMREWLVRLRQTCLHAHVGKRNRKALGAKNGPLRTVHEVLEVMIEQNDTAMKAEARESILAELRSGHIQGNAGNIEDRSVLASLAYKSALNDTQAWVKECREELAAEKEKLGTPGLDDPDVEDENKEDENLGRIPAIRKALRSFLELEHACLFFLGSTYFQMKSDEKLTKPDSEDFHRLEKLEVECYDKAKDIRKELLQESQRKAHRQMDKINSRKPFHQLSHLDDIPDLGGIEGKKILDMMDSVCDVLNTQASQLEKWRQKIVDILLLPLVDQDEGKETTGDEYEDSTKIQDELYIYIMALRTLVADRNTAVNGVLDNLLEHEWKQAESQALKKEGHAPDLVLDVVEKRRKLKPTGDVGSLKGVVSATRSLLTSLQWKADGGDQRAAIELAIVQKQISKIQTIFAEEAKALTELEKEQELFRAAMNQRLEYYRQLQHISDTVAPWREELDEEFQATLFEREWTKHKASRQRLAGFKAKHSYLVNLRDENQQLDAKHECIICQDEFEIGVLTSCGHKVSTSVTGRSTECSLFDSTVKSALITGGIRTAHVRSARFDSIRATLRTLLSNPALSGRKRRIKSKRTAR